MDGIRKKPIIIKDLEKRLMFDASLGALNASTTISENLVNTAPQVIDNDVTIIATTTNFDGLALDITTSGGASDQLSIRNEGAGFGDIGFDGTNITYSGVQIGTLSSNGANGSDLSIELNGNADKTGIENLIENITYQNTSDNPVIARNISFALEGLFTESITVNISPDNDTPTINANNGMNIDEGDTKKITAAMLGISDPDNTDAEITITLNNTLSNGRLELTTNAGVGITEFTLDDLNNNRVRYVHDNTDTTSDSFNFSVDDGSITLAAQNFNINIGPVDDAPVLESNAGADVFNGFSTDIGGTVVPAQFGTTILTQSKDNLGEFANFQNQTDGNNITQLRLVVTTPAGMPIGAPGQVIFESGGSGRGISLILNANNELTFYAGSASTTPEITSPLALSTSTQYAIIVEIDKIADELRLHYAQSNDFDWYQYGRLPEAIETGFTDSDLDGGNNAGLGAVGGNSIGGYNGSFNSTNATFQGSIDSDFIVSLPPAGQTVIQNTNLVYNDNDTDTDDIIYTITTDVLYGTLYNDGVALALGDTFTQADLDAGDIDYTHDGGATPNDSFSFSVSDGNTTLSGNNYAINVITGNTTPTTADDTFTIAEDAGNGNNVGQVTATDPDTVGGQVLTYTITAGNTDGIFQIDAATGLISVADNTLLDYETTTAYTLTVRATDDGPGTLFDEGTITINIQDVYEGTAPVFTSWGPYNIDENVANNAVVGTVTTTDAEGDNVNYSITAGNTNSAFKINNSGVIQVNGNGKIDFEQNTTYTLTIRATDDSVDTLFSQRTMTININDLNEGPTLEIDGVIATIDKTVNYYADNGNFYKYYNNNVGFSTALNNAAAAALNGAGGHLVTITSDNENTFVDNILGNHIWLAASDAEVEGQWKWVAGPEAGSVFSLGGTATAGFYERWNGSEPNSGASANNAYMNTNGTWYDQNGGSRYYVVEWESMDVINNRSYSIDYSTPGGGDINNGDSLGFVQGGDDDGDTLAYSITGGNGDGIFEIDGVTGELRIADDTNINTALNSDYTLTVRVDDGSGLFATKDIAINFNQLLSIGTNETLAATEGASVTITTAELNILDNDTAAGDLVISITSQPSHGQLELTTAPGAAINSFTQDDLANNRVVFVSNGNENTADSFEFSVSDGSYSITGQTFDIDVTNTNDSPVISINTGANVLEGGSRVITSAMLDALDSDDAPSGLTYTATNLANGHIEVSGATQTTFTQADIDAGTVRFVHNGDEGNGSFDIELADSGADGATTDTGTFTLTKTDVNDAPIIAVNTGASVVEGQSVVVTSAMLAATDIDDNNANLVYTLTNQFNGNFVFASAPAIPITTFTQDDINNNRVLFQHDGNEQDGIIEFSVADDGADGALPATGTFTIAKIDVNDAPTIAVNIGTSVNQNSIVILKNSVLAAADTDDAPSGIDYTIDSVSGGQLEYLANPNVAITSFTQADINNSLVVFRHADPAPSASFDFTVSDGGENLAGTASGTFNLTVDNTNNAPDITTNAAPTMDEGTTITLGNTMLDSFDPDDFGAGLTWTATNLQSGILQVGGVTQNTFTQEDLDNGDVTFTHDGSQTITAGFTVTLADGGENNATTDTVFFKINIDQVNNLPIIDANSGDTLDEGGTVPIDNTELATSDSDINEADWYDGNWQYRQQITLESDYVDADLTNFTLLISGDNFSRDFWDNVKADGSDIVITLADGTKLSRELVSINRGAERMELHVNIPMLSSTVDTELFIYYDNFAASETNDAATVFAGYDHVYHMNQLNAVDIIGANNGTNSGGGSITTGVMGNAHSYSGTGRLDIAAIDGDDIASVSLWYRPDGQGGGNYGSILGSNSYNDGIRHTTTDALNLRDDANNILTTTPDFDTFKYLVFSYDQSTGTINLYENGALQDTSTYTGWYDVQHLIGIANDTSRAIDGIIDEIRITGEVITQEQAAAEYANQNSPSLFYSLSGQQQYVPEVLTYTVSTEAANGTLYLDANTNGILDGGEALALNDTFTQDDIDAGLLLYTHDGGESISDSFGYTISDAEGTTAAQTFNFTINPVNDAPVISTNAPPTINEGASVTLTAGMLDVTDPDDADADLLWTISNLANGTLEVDGTAQSTFTHAQLINGDVVFTHDGSETITAGFDIAVADDEGASASGSFAITVTPLNDAPTLILNDGDPNILDLNDYTFISYTNQAGQDLYGNALISADGTTVTFTNINAWKEISTPYTLTNNTVLSFEFFADRALEIQGIGFENGNTDFDFLGYELLGSQPWHLNDSYRGYQVGDGWVRYDITIGQNFTSATDITTMVFALDNDANATGTTAFRNINFYESDLIVEVEEGGALTLTNTHLNSIDPDDTGADRIFTATNITNGHIEVSGVTSITFTQADINAGNVAFIHDGSQTLSAGFDIGLTDDDGAGTDTGRFDIIVNAVDDAPATATNNGLATTEGATTTITTAALTTSDIDTPASDVVFTVTNNVDNGRLARTTNTALAISSFTLADLQNNRVVYIHNSTETTTDSFTFTISDGTTTVPADTFNISITPVNDVPIIIGDTAATMAEGASYTITNADVNYTDADDAAAAIAYTASNITNGHIEVSGVTATTFTQGNINAGNVRFIHDGSETITAGFDLAITDDEGAGTDTTTMTITVTPVNDAPVATNNGLTTSEGGTATITTAALNISDPDTAATNLVVSVTSAASNGYLALSGDSATPINSFTLANLQANQVIYVHNGGETTTDSFTFTVSDGTNTLAADTFSIAITPVNDAVTLATNTGANVGESNAVTINNTMLNTTDADNIAAQITYTVTSTSNGWVELTTKSGFPVTSFTQSDINNNRVVFRHDGSGQTAASFAFSVNDTGAGGTAPVTGTFALTVTPPVNDAPVIAISDGTPTTIDFSATTITPYDPTNVGDGQNGTPTAFKVSGDGSVLTLYGNAWKRIPLPMAITVDTVITFDFRSTKEGEIHGIGFDNDNSYSNGHHAYELFGIDTNGGFDQTYNTYSLGDGWTRYEIPVGADYTGTITHIFFVADDDQGANSDGISQFRNVSIYEVGAAFTANEGGAVTITNANLNAFDTDDAPGALTYTATNITNGHIETSGVTTTSFTQADINAGNVRFIHDGSETLSAGFDIGLTDDDGAGTDTASLSITITPVNDAPVITGDYTLSVNEGAGATITATDLDSADPDDTVANRTFTATNITNGHIEVSGVTATTFTQADINAGNVRFLHDGSETLSAGFDIALTDDEGAGTETASMAITVTPVNDNSPSDITLDNTTISENTAIGTALGTLSGTDPDTGDVLTYSLPDDAGGKFRIEGDQVVVNGTLDYEQASLLSITVRATDLNNNSFDRTMAITITDVSEAELFVNNTAQSTNNNLAAGRGETKFHTGFSQNSTRAIFNVSDILNPLGIYAPDSLIASTILNGPGQANDLAFYGDAIQILRSNTSTIMQTLPDLQDSIVISFTGDIGAQGDQQIIANNAPENQNTINGDLREFMEQQDQLKKALLELEDMDSADSFKPDTNMDIFEITSIDDQFRDVLTYQQQKQAALREALLKS